LHNAAYGNDPNQHLKKADYRSQVLVALGHQDYPHGIKGNITNPHAKNKQRKDKVIEQGGVNEFHAPNILDFENTNNAVMRDNA
jgi:hypothetical protein